ncbi:TraB/GumN family protein [Sphingomicrobium sediminis]|uniref:TraB/GumN family protein n=1 Tax=Sphingomicrobium sediminis TaxID=2950949 RepID=A0A9X2EFP4_9SPHN|nr:TraB/GumN family protein [Sphingomicrobium sediminis]MCM8557130.1 TraB/GumN family protein [Sphingomicrobium sediminis]
MTRIAALAGTAIALTLGACSSTGSNVEPYDSSAAVSIAPPVSAADTTDRVDPAIWLVSDEDTAIYLLGTFHLLPADYEWRTPLIDTAIANSQELILETLIDPDKPAELTMAIQELGISPGLPPILSRVPPTYRPRLEARIAQSGYPVTAFNAMESWAAGLTFFSFQMADLGLSSDAGVEVDLRAAFEAANKPLGQLETNVEQLSYLDGMSEATQRAFLASTLESPEETKAQFSDMLAAWTRGDVDAIAMTFNDGMAPGSELREAILTRRNAKWADWIDARLDQPGTIMIAVGAGHLAGPDSLVRMVSADGHSVQRLN